jgi:hypothetical protein
MATPLTRRSEFGSRLSGLSELGPSADTEPKRLEARAVSHVFSFLALLIALALLAPTAADADLWGQLTYGRDIARHAWVHTTDPYSFTSDRPWINHEWLSVLIFWAVYAVAGAPGLVTLKLLVACAIGFCVLTVWERYTLSPKWRDALLFITAWGLWPLFSTIRPQVFSLGLLAALLLILERFRERQQRTLFLLPLLFVLWVNLHGGWLVGAGVLVLFVLCTLFDRNTNRQSRLLLIAAAAASAAGTLINPYGLQMLTFLFQTVRLDRADIVEWQPVTQLPPVVLVLWCVPTLIALGAVWRGRRDVPLFSILTIAMLGIASFRVARLGGFYALSVGMLLAPYLKASATPLRTFREIRIWRPAAVCTLAVTLVVACFGRQITMDGAWLPERAATEFVKTHGLTGRMLTWFNYGQYAIWHFSPAIQVSMDGRREAIYSDDLRALHWRIYRNEPTALADVARLDPDYIWLPANFPVVTRLQNAGWHPLFTGSRSTLLGKRTVGMQTRVNTTACGSSSPCSRASYFPGP